MLATTVSATAAALARTDGQIAGLRRDVESRLARIEERVAGPSADAREVAELRRRLDALGTRPSKTSGDQRVDQLHSKLRLLVERVDTLATTVASTASGLAGREGELAALRSRLDEQASPGTAATTEGLVRRVEDLGAASATATMRVEAHGAQIAALRGDLDRLTADVGSSLADLRLSIAELDLRHEELRTRIARVEGRSSAPERRADRPAPPSAAPPSEEESRLLDELRALERRLESQDTAARQERDALLSGLERLGSRIDGTLQRLESGSEATTGSGAVGVGAEIVPLRGTDP